jgi:hypothetical protein
MRIIGVDLHTRKQSVALLDTDTGELVGKTLKHEGEKVREFYSALPRPVLVGIEATPQSIPRHGLSVSAWAASCHRRESMAPVVVAGARRVFAPS